MTLLLSFSFLLLILYSGLLLYYRSAWNSLPVFNAAGSNPGSSTFITVLVPARNEAENISDLLASLAAQTYPPRLFEVIVIDDHSTDNTAEIVRKYPSVKLLSLENFMPQGSVNSYKKKAIEVGIQQSGGKLIVSTDADCYAPVNWLQTIASFYETYKPAFIVMPVAINCSNRPIEIFQALDFMTLQGITGAAVHKKMHSMCNGANLAYTREAFDSVNGFEGIDKIASGDDMLLMHKIAKKYPDGVRYIHSKDAIVQTAPVHTVKEFLNQRIRWASKSDKYEDKRIFWVLLLVYLFNVILFVLPILALISRDWFLFSNWILLLFLKTITELFFLLPVSIFFNKERLLLAFPLAQPFHIMYTVIAGWLGKFGSYKWKDRNVK
jgi:cellulose synthase/poly-beta-1,6-N-acetylglucosamine synthase-like glycosyltransferase